jgi:hypothetical protein
LIKTQNTTYIFHQKKLQLQIKPLLSTPNITKHEKKKTKKKRRKIKYLSCKIEDEKKQTKPIQLKTR